MLNALLNQIRTYIAIIGVCDVLVNKYDIVKYLDIIYNLVYIITLFDRREVFLAGVEYV